MHDLIHAASESKHEQASLVELGAIPALVSCISADNSKCSMAAIYNLLHLCGKLF
jgi:hypothetical protein